MTWRAAWEPFRQVCHRLHRLRTVAWLQPLAAFGWTLRWLCLAALVGTAAGLTSAGFLTVLDWVTSHRETHPGLIGLLPLAGGVTGWVYHRYGREANAGYAAILSQVHKPTQVLPLRMAPLVLVGTLVTHWFGGSAGREGTAVQISSVLADQLTYSFGVRRRDRPHLLMMGISAGFSAVFGTPLAGAIFALEILGIGQVRYAALLPSLWAALIADRVCHACGVSHTHYLIGEVPSFTWETLGWAMLVGGICGIVALLFNKFSHFVTDLFRRWIDYPPLRPVVGGLLVAVFVWCTGKTSLIGLGIPTIEQAFGAPSHWHDFLLKLILTAVTVGAGFKGGEATPLFFIGATLGSALSLVIPLPIGFLAALGFVAVFAGATQTPLACLMMGLELFGMDAAWYLAMATCTAYTFSGEIGIYRSQQPGDSKRGPDKH